MRRELQVATAIALLASCFHSTSISASHAAPPDSACLTVSVTDTLTASSAFVGSDCVISFTSGTGTWTPPAGLNAANLLIIGGGGGGGAAYDNAGAGGGGAGLVTYQSLFTIQSNGRYTISVGAAGSAGVGSSSVPRETVGGAGGDSFITRQSNGVEVRAYGGSGGSASRNTAAGNSGVGKAGGVAATSSSGAKGGNSGSGGGGGGGGGGNLTAGGNGGTGSGSGGSAGTGVAYSTRTGSSVTYGAGGAGGAPVAGSGTGSAGATATTPGNGGGGGSSGSASQASGGAGAPGLVVIRYRLPAEFSAIALSSGTTTAVFRRESTINVTMNLDSKVSYTVDGVRLPGCVSLRTTGSASTWNSSCIWKPSKKGLTTVLVTATSPSSGMTSTATLRIAVSQRTNNR